MGGGHHDINNSPDIAERSPLDNNCSKILPSSLCGEECPSTRFEQLFPHLAKGTLSMHLVKPRLILS